jgi:uncharacterized protein YecT (DUF1311 family)
MKYWVLIFVLTLVACSPLKNQLPLSTATSIPPTPQVIQVTHIVTIKQTVVVTVTPKPPLAQECLNKAVTQGDLNNCANLERELAKNELDKIISRIKFSPEEKEVFDQLQLEWEKQVEKDCGLFYGWLLTDGNGNLHYKWGSMAPMQRGFCEAERYKQRIKELEFAYLKPNG